MKRRWKYRLRTRIWTIWTGLSKGSERQARHHGYVTCSPPPIWWSHSRESYKSWNSWAINFSALITVQFAMKMSSRHSLRPTYLLAVNYSGECWCWHAGDDYDGQWRQQCRRHEWCHRADGMRSSRAPVLAHAQSHCRYMRVNRTQ